MMKILHGNATRFISTKKEKRRTIMNIYVGNLSFETTDVMIREAF